MAKAGRLPDFRKMYPEASEEIISVLKETEKEDAVSGIRSESRNRRYVDRKNRKSKHSARKEDSLDRMMEAGLFPDRGEQDIGGRKYVAELQYEKLHRAIRQLEKREQY